MNLRSVALSLVLTCTAATALAADANSFILTRAGKQVGKASYTIDKAKDGSFHGKARFEYRLASAMSLNTTTGADNTGNQITEGQYTFDFKADPAGRFLSGYLQNMATQTILSFQPDKARTTVTIGEAQGGSTQSKSLTMPLPDYLVTPDYDPSAIQVFLTAAFAHPHEDGKYALVIPGNGRTLTSFIYVALKPATDANGTLDGKPVTLKHYQLQFYKGMGDLYTDADGTLMQADIPTLSASYTRVKFALATQ